MQHYDEYSDIIRINTKDKAIWIFYSYCFLYIGEVSYEFKYAEKIYE